MRTPDNEQESTSSGSLADGFAGADGDGSESAAADDAFGSGWPGSADAGAGDESADGGDGGDGGAEATEAFGFAHGSSSFGESGDLGGPAEAGFDEPAFSQEDAPDEVAAFDGGDELSPFELEPDYVPDTDTDWDVTGDGVVDEHDLHEAGTALSDFHVDADDSHGHAPDEGFFPAE